MNPITPVSEVTLADGKVYRLTFNHRAFATTEYQLKRQGWDISLLGPRAKDFWLDIASGGENEASLDQFKVGVLLYCGLICDNPKLTLGEAQDLISFGNMVEVTTAVLTAALEAMAPFTERGKTAPEGDERPLAAGNGGASDGPPPDSTSDSPTLSSGN